MNASSSPQAVVVATDGSPSACSAVVWAAHDAAGWRRPLRIVHVKEFWPVGAYGLAGGLPLEIDDIRNEEGLEILEVARKLVTEACPELPVTTRLIHGPTFVMLREAADHGSELVVGHRGMGRFAELLVGSVALRVAGHTGSPVVVVRGDATVSKGEVLVGVDLDEPMDGPLGYAFEAAQHRGATLRAVYAWLLTDDFTTALKGTRGFIDPLERLSALLAPWRTRFPDVKVVEKMIVDHPVAALTRASADADLVVVGSHRQGAVGTVLLGSVGHGLLHHAHCPVAVVSAPRDQGPAH